MILKECMLIKNACYIHNKKITNGKPTGIVVHSIGANNKTLKRYVQPVSSQPYYNEVIADLGKNIYSNHWNNYYVEHKICSHREAYLAGYGNNHGDCDHWLKRFGKNMDWFRGQVKSQLNEENNTHNRKSIEELAQEVIDGKWGNGTARKNALTSAGYNYSKVQKRVNEILRNSR